MIRVTIECEACGVRGVEEKDAKLTCGSCGHVKSLKVIKKPRVSFCWECGLKLRGNHHMEIKPDGMMETVVVHKACAKRVN